MRLWGKAFARDESVTPAGQTANDYWRAGRLGFRGDWTMGGGHRLTLSGQAYDGPAGDTWQIPDISSPSGVTLTNMPQKARGGFLLARNEWTLQGGSEAAVQAYVATGEQETEGAFKEQRTTVDLDFQHRLLLGKRHDLISGLGYRYSRDDMGSAGLINILPQKRSFSLASAFIQDEFTLLPDTLRLLLGLRLEDNSFSGFAPLPNARMIWTPSPHQALWTSVSRALRIPSRVDLGAEVDGAVIPARSAINPTPLPILIRNVPNDRDVANETLTAYEIGYRHQFDPALLADFALFYNLYNDLLGRMSGTPQLVLAPPQPYLLQPVSSDNNVKAHTHGVEMAIDWYPLPWWRIQPIYSYLNLRASSKTGDQASLVAAATLNDSDPHHQLSLRSSMSLSDRQQFDIWLRHVGKLASSGSAAHVPAFTTLDLRYAWRPTRDLELSLVGQNLLDGQHPESVSNMLPASRNLETQRGYYLKARWQF
jgi:iron complex outermembrane receptor protein